MKNYGIREGYVALTEAVTVSEDSTLYWNAERIAKSGFYQFDVYRAAARHLAASSHRAFIDVGCGYPKKVRELICPLTKDVTLVDHPSMGDVIGRDFPDLSFVPVDLEQPRWRGEEQFDLVLSADVIEHLLDPDPFLDFLGSLLRPGGMLFLSTPERDFLRGPGCTGSPKAEHVREWSSEELQRYLASRGFEVIEHHLLPVGRLSRWEEVLQPLFQPIFRRRYRACQLAVCRLAS